MDAIHKLYTHFDTPERTDADQIVNVSRLLGDQPLIQNLLEGFPDFAVIVDENRQIVAYNSFSESIFNSVKNGNVLGLRVGEALNCANIADYGGDCGTGKFCSQCGAGQCLYKTKRTQSKHSEECSILVRKTDGDQSLELRVSTTPFTYLEKRFMIFAVENIEHEKSREALEHIFFHDVLNTATAVQGVASLIPEAETETEMNEYIQILVSSSDQLVNEIKDQRDLSYAESGSLAVRIKDVSVNELLKKVADLYTELKKGKGIEINCEFRKEDIKLKTDDVILIRSLGNLLKNALEASMPGDEVKLFSKLNNDHLVFNVWNKQYISFKHQASIFKRAFSTKAPYGRGLGTYSVKLLVERYLGGRVSFSSDEATGTLFSVAVPCNIDHNSGYTASSKVIKVYAS